jgi:penicillin G amidase
VPMEQVPAVLNPERGFVSSANQSPVSVEDYPYYLGSSFAGYERSARINQRLTAMTQATPDSFKLMQTDNFSFVPKNVLPALLALVQQEKLTNPQKKAYQLLASWNYKFDPELVAPTLFEEWWQQFARAVWGDEFPAATYKAPSRDRLVQLLLHEPQARWYDNIETPQKETLTDLVNTTFLQVADSMGITDQQWKWGRAKNSSINHLAQLSGFGHTLHSGGSANSINALNGSHGPSWRMVVQLGPKVQAWGVYPGGQSGNPGSRFYDNLLQDWQAGKLHELLFLKGVEDRKEKTDVMWVMKGKRNEFAK